MKTKLKISLISVFITLIFFMGMVSPATTAQAVYFMDDGEDPPDEDWDEWDVIGFGCGYARGLGSPDECLQFDDYYFTLWASISSDNFDSTTSDFTWIVVPKYYITMDPWGGQVHTALCTHCSDGGTGIWEIRWSVRSVFALIREGRIQICERDPYGTWVTHWDSGWTTSLDNLNGWHYDMKIKRLSDGKTMQFYFDGSYQVQWTSDSDLWSSEPNDLWFKARIDNVFHPITAGFYHMAVYKE